MRVVRMFALLIALSVAACGGGAGGGGGGGGAVAPPAAAPPVGKAWFGTGFEAGTLNLQGQTTSVKAGTPVVALGTFLSARAPSEVNVQVVLQGTERARIPVPDGSPTNVMGVDLTSLNLRPGVYLVNFVSTNRRTLAAGTLTIN